jgi:hypothetical protein
LQRIAWWMLGTIAVLTPVAQAGALALDIVENPAGTGTPGTSSSVGWQFQVNTPILVDGLAFWDHVDTQNHDVGIFNDATQLLLVSATVLPTDPQIGTGPWRVHSIAPFLLAPGTYDIAAATGIDNYTFNPFSMITIPQITWLQDRSLFGSAVLAFPSDSSGNGLRAWFGASFTAALTVPEPIPFVLIGAGLLALSIVQRRRRNRTIPPVDPTSSAAPSPGSPD